MREKNRPDSLNRSERPQRNSINGSRDKMSVKGLEEGFHYVWVNDYNVDTFLAGSYDFVTHDVVVGDKHINFASQEGGRISMPVGNGIYGFLMRIPNEYYEEDLQAQQRDIDERENAMQKELNSKTDGRYGKVELSQSKSN
jgi:hypothetical protein